MLYVICLAAALTMSTHATVTPELAEPDVVLLASASAATDLLPGDRVVLLQDDPPGGEGLIAGRSGTIVCCANANCSGDILVSWDFWANSKVDTSDCSGDAPETIPPNSAVWINPDEVLIGRAFDQDGTILIDNAGYIYFDADDGFTYNVVGGGALDILLTQKDAQITLGDRVRIQGLLSTTSSIPDYPLRDGGIYHPILSGI
jgi:hypothetical protein